MQLNFSTLNSFDKKIVGTTGTVGTTNSHAGLSRPQIAKNIRDKWGQNARAGALDKNLSPMSQLSKTGWGQRKAASILIVPTVPNVPTEKHKNSNEIDKHALTREALAQFRFDLVQSEIDAGHPCGEVHRVNNMAWEFMQADGMAFDAAITLAAQIVTHSQVATCEAAYVDVLALFKRLQIRGVHWS